MGRWGRCPMGRWGRSGGRCTFGRGGAGRISGFGPTSDFGTTPGLRRGSTGSGKGARFGPWRRHGRRSPRSTPSADRRPWARPRRPGRSRSRRSPRAARIVTEHTADGVKEFIDELVAAVAEHGPPTPPPGPVAAPGDAGAPAEGPPPSGDDIPVPAVFPVNVLRHHDADERAPIVVASAPSRAGLFGTIEITGTSSWRRCVTRQTTSSVLPP